MKSITTIGFLLISTIAVLIILFADKFMSLCLNIKDLFEKQEFLYFNEYCRKDNPEIPIYSKLHESYQEAVEYQFDFFNTVWVATHKIKRPKVHK